MLGTGFNAACKHVQCCDARDCWKYDTTHGSWVDPDPEEHDAKGWPVAGARRNGVLCRDSRCTEALSRTDGSRHSLEEAGQRVTAARVQEQVGAGRQAAEAVAEEGEEAEEAEAVAIDWAIEHVTEAEARWEERAAARREYNIERYCRDV